MWICPSFVPVLRFFFPFPVTNGMVVEISAILNGGFVFVNKLLLFKETK